MYKVGDKVVPHSKSIGASWEEWRNWQEEDKKVFSFLYVTRIQEDGKISCSITSTGLGDHFLEKDLTLYVEPKENGLFQEFEGVKCTELKVKDLIDLVNKGIIKETDVIIVGRK